MKEDKKRAVTILLHNDDGDILAVSRKNDINDFGLPGGKVDEGETDEQAIIRETKEETGLDIFNIRSFFTREDGEYMATTFIGNYTGEIKTTEKGKVIWTNFDKIKRGSFGKYNVQLETHFNEYHKYTTGDLIINPETGEAFSILHKVEACNDGAVSGYFIKAFCSNTGHAFIRKTALDNVRMFFIASASMIGPGGNMIPGFNPKIFLDKKIIEASATETAQSRHFACLSHFDANQYYMLDKAKGIDVLYSYHLRKVVEVGRKFKHLIPSEDWSYVEGGLWNHDCVEDARQTFNDLKEAIGEKSALIAFALTNSTGKKRDERADAAYYLKIRETKYATFAKLCDRIANFEHGLKFVSSMTKKYKKEHEHFKKELYVAGELEPMWDYLAKLMEYKVITEKERSKGRSENYYQLPQQEQWDEDKLLGLLDWDGK